MGRMNLHGRCAVFGLLAIGWLAVSLSARQPASIRIETPMIAPTWARLERKLLEENVPACREFYEKYYNEHGYLECFVRWGAADGPDDAFENFNHWPELHALGASDEIKQTYVRAWEAMLRQYTEAKTVQVPVARHGMYYRDFCAQSDWFHHNEGLQLFNRMGLSVPDMPRYQKLMRQFAGFYMGTDPEVRNYDPKHKIIRSMINGSRGPLLQPATPLDWAGDPFDPADLVIPYQLDHFREYTDVVGDHFLNLGSTTLALGAYMIAHEPQYKRWLLEYMDAWLDRMNRNNGIIPSYVALDGRIGGAEGKWWGNTYGWGFSPIEPTTGKRENRNTIRSAQIGFYDALLISGDRKYLQAWRTMRDSINSHARTVDGRKEYPTMFGSAGWYGWEPTPWNVNGYELWYWSMDPDDRARLTSDEWINFLEGKNPDYPETSLTADLESIPRKLEEMRKDQVPAAKRPADHMRDYNPAATSALMHLMCGALPPGVQNGLLSMRLRYFDPVARRAGVPQDVGALVSEMSDTRTVVTLVNLNQNKSRDVIVQAGAYGEHEVVSVETEGRRTRVGSPVFSVKLAPGSGAKCVLTMRRYVNAPTINFPWSR